MNSDWRPVASAQTLSDRSSLVWNIREFFQSKGVIEVHTPVVGSQTVTDIQIDSIPVQRGFLQTSPEFFMKRLLASGVPSCYQIGPVFRDGEVGKWHNPEFMMLEWYRIGFDSRQLREEVEGLVDLVLGTGTYRTVTYKDLIGEEIGIDVFDTSPREIHRVAVHLGYSGSEDFTEVCDFLYSQAMNSCDCSRYFVVDFPEESAALAETKISESGMVADRFELIASRIELANGYNELLDPDELKRRMALDNKIRCDKSKSAVDPDERLLDAMRHGLPQCSGVAIGLDRLVALALGFESLGQVMTFPVNRI
ncbi:MAG: EF-P lysine aminoacylase EpmA [Gammaproteobacteria bacterium]|nr:EF-P lysine aminoacylase EpmA [Gammaproteobacteria bacterium]